MISTLVYALFGVPIHIYKKSKGRSDRSPYLAMRVVPLAAVLSLVLGIAVMAVANQTILQLGQRTPANMAFSVSTWVFAGLSLLSLFTSYRSIAKPVTIFARTFAILVSCACLGMTLYLGYWGLIGIRLWAY